MNSNFSTLSLSQIQEKLNQLDLNSLEILEWEDTNQWQKKINKLNQTKCLSRYLVIPNTKDMLSQFMKVCGEQQWRIYPIGNGSKISWGKSPNEFDFFVSTVKQNNIIEHAVDDLIITVESGMTINELQKYLSTHGQFFPIDACYQEEATIGGIVATANAGSWRQRYGGVRDLILGISFLRSDGQEVKAGGKVVKNVAGYDLMKLFTGSYGNLGLITSVTLRLFPIPSDSATILVTGEIEAIKKLRTTIVCSGLTPTCADLLSPSIVQNFDLGNNLALLLRFQSISASVKQQLSQIQTWATELDLTTHTYQSEAELQLWQKTKQLSSITTDNKNILCKIGIISNQTVDFLANCQGDCVLNISTGVGYGVFPTSTSVTALKNLRELCEENSGFLTILEANVEIKEKIEPWGYVGNIQRMMRILKEKFDPQGIFID